MFSNQTFEILQGLRDQIRQDRGRSDKQALAFYRANKDALRQYVQDPFQELAGAVAARLPRSITRELVTNQKSNFGQVWLGGGAVDYYWGAFYPKRSARKQLDAQLLIFLEPNYLEFGFFFGWDCTNQQLAAFKDNCIQLQKNVQGYTQLLNFFREHLPENQVVHRDTEYSFGDDGSVARIDGAVFTWDDLLRLRIPDDRIGTSPMLVLPTEQVIKMPKQEVAERIAHAFICLYPLVLLAVDQSPIQKIDSYLADTRRGG